MTDGQEIGLSEEQQANFGNFVKWLWTSQIKAARGIANTLGGGGTIHLSRDDLRKIEKSIILTQTSHTAAHRDSQILCKVVAHLRRIKVATGASPRISTIFTLPQNSFSKGVVEAVTSVRKWIEVEKGWIDQCGFAPPVELAVLSAILHGGLLNKSGIAGFVRALHRPEDNVGFIGNNLYVNLELSWQGEPGMEARRWQPDEQTACMIWPPEKNIALTSSDSIKVGELEGEKGLLDQVFRRIVGRMREDQIPIPLRPKSLSDLLNTVELAARTEIPAVLVDYAARQFVSHSLRPEVLRRLYRQPSRPAQPPPVESPAEDEKLFLTKADRESSDDIEPRGLTELRAALRGTSKEKVLVKLRSTLKENEKSSAWRLITEFAEYLLTRRSKAQTGPYWKKNLQLSTVKAYAINEIGRKFGRLLGGDNPARLDPESLETFFAEVLENTIESASATDHGKALRSVRATRTALQEFHAFLVSEYKVVPIREAGLLGTGRGLLPVDATIITVEEFIKARKTIREDTNSVRDERVRLIAEAMLILGFRCGARRMEARDLQIDDLLIEGEPWLLIRPWGDHELKTVNSIRQLPLECLVPKDELEVLVKCKEKAQEISDNQYLFGMPHPERKFEAIPEDVVMPIIHGALRKATEDNRIRFHHCRHSFATWNFFRLMLSDLPEMPNLFPHLKETSAWLKESRRFRKTLYGSDQRITRKHTRALASLLGHSGPNVSCIHYLHCFDWLLPHFLKHSVLLGPCDAKRLSAVIGRSLSTTYVYQQKTTSISVLVFEERFPEYAKQFKSLAVESVPATPANASTPSISDHWSLLFLYQTTKEGLHDIADRFGFDPQQTSAILDRADALQKIREPRGKTVLRHWRQFEYPVEEGVLEHPELFCPERPESKSADKLVQDLEPLVAKNANFRSVISYYVNNIWRTEMVVPFRDPDKPADAVEYVHFLKDLGFVSQSSIRYVSLDPSLNSVTRPKWQQALGITATQLERGALFGMPYSKLSNATEKCVLIEPRLDPERAKAFRFLMVMAAIAFGF